MSPSKISYVANRLLVLQSIDIFINLGGAAITYVWFSQIQPGLNGRDDVAIIRDRAIFVVILIITILGLGRPYEFRWFSPLVKQFRIPGIKCNEQTLQSTELKRLSDLSRKLLNVPIRMSLTNTWAWLISAVIFTIIPHA